VAAVSHLLHDPISDAGILTFEMIKIGQTQDILQPETVQDLLQSL